MNFNETNTEPDNNLTPEELAEWNAVYASHKAGSILTGEVTGVDDYSLNNETKILAAVVIRGFIKILIPENLLWDDYKNMPNNVTRNTLGAKIDFVIQAIDRENNVCVASRIAATRIKRKKFLGGKPKTGDRVKCNVLSVGMKKILVETCGFDLKLGRRSLCYSLSPDFRMRYAAGQTLTAVITKVSKRENSLLVSVRDAKTNPYIGLQKRHPVNSRRASVITGKYEGAVFCKLEDDYDCLCLYSEHQSDDNFQIGDKVIIAVKEFDDKFQRVYGVILSKWN